MRIGDIIHDYRVKNKTSMELFAKNAGVSKAYISLLEKGYDPRTQREIIPSVTTIQKVARAMGTTFDELFKKLDGDILLNDEMTTRDPISIEILRNIENMSAGARKLVLQFVLFLGNIPEQQLSVKD